MLRFLDDVPRVEASGLKCARKAAGAAAVHPEDSDHLHAPRRVLSGRSHPRQATVAYDVKRLYLHIGRGKTGTTAIQVFLSRNRAALQSRGVDYVHARDADRGGGHQRFAKSLVTDPPDFMKLPRKPEAARAAIAAEVAGSQAPSVLLSSENLTLVDPTLLATFAEECGIEDVRVIFFGRSQDEVAESQYNQLVKLWRVQMPFAEYLATEMGEVDYSALLEPWADTFGPERIIARVYDAGSESVIDDFLSCLPLRDRGDPFDRTRSDENESVGFLALEVYRKLNGFELERKERRVLSQSPPPGSQVEGCTSSPFQRGRCAELSRPVP